jgi:hypothetical protein
MSAIAKKWLAEKDPKFRDEAQSLLERMTADAGNAKVSVDRHGILGFGEGADGYPLVALTVRKDGLRLYANTFELAKHKAALGKTLTGKSCVTLRRASDIHDKLLSKIVKGSLAAKALGVK